MCTIETLFCPSHALTRVCTQIIHTHKCARAQIHTHKQTHTQTDAHTHIHTHTHTQMCTCTNTHANTHKQVHTHKHTHTHTHTRTIIHTCRWNRCCDESLLRGASVRGVHPPKEAVRRVKCQIAYIYICLICLMKGTEKGGGMINEYSFKGVHPPKEAVRTVKCQIVCECV